MEDSEKRRVLEQRFPNTVIAACVDSGIDVVRMNEIIAAARVKVHGEFEVVSRFSCHELRRPPPCESHHRLIRKEEQVLKMLAGGHSYKSICAELLIAYKTLRTHVQHLYAKLQVRRVNEAVSKSLREDFVK